LLNITDHGEEATLLPSVKSVLEEDWTTLFKDDIINKITTNILNTQDEEDLKDVILQKVKECIEEGKESHISCALLGISCLQIFIQANWTGPSLNCESLGLLGQLLNSKELNNRSLDALQIDGEVLYHFVKYPILLLVAHTILIEARDLLKQYRTIHLWAVKCLASYTTVVEKTCASLLHTFQDVSEEVEEMQLLDALPSDITAEFFMECSHLYLQFYDYDKMKQCMQKAKEVLGIDISLSSALGKRTRFQQTALPQMKLDISINQERNVPVKTQGEATKDLPTDVVLDEETVLPHVKFLDSDALAKTDLSVMDQAYIISTCAQLQRTRPKDVFTPEEMMPFIEAVLRSPQKWSIQNKSLFLRSVLEMNAARKAERAMSQLEELNKSVMKDAPKGINRVQHVHCINLQPLWETERALAQFFIGLGCNDSALEIFIRLQLWDDVIGCYSRLGRHGKAEEVIREQLKIKETPTLYCMLGDATMDHQHYVKAWNLSKERSARSQRSLGLYYLRKQQMEECIEPFQRSLKLNQLQPNIWFSLGCACMTLKNMEGAARALQQCVALDPENAQAWSNLSSAFIRLGQLPKAYKALQVATGLSYNNWRIWQNFLLVTADIGAFDELIHCCHRLVDLKRKDLDIEALQVLVRAVLEDMDDYRGMPVGRLLPKLFELFGHITSQITDNPAIWSLYADLSLSKETAQDSEKALHHLYKSHRCYLQNHQWEKNVSKIPEVMHVTARLFDVTKEVSGHPEYQARAVHFLSTTKMCLSNLLLRFQKSFLDDSGNLLEDVKPHALLLERNIQELQTMIVSCS